MKKVFLDEYNQILSDSTFKEVDEITDQEQLNDARTELTELLKMIQSELNIVCSEIEEEQAKREAEEKKAKEDADKLANQNSNSSNSNNSSSSSKPYVVKSKGWETDEGITWVYWYSDDSIWYQDYDGSMHDITNNSDIWGE